MMLWQCFLVTSELRSEVVINKVIEWLNILAIPWGRSLFINGGGGVGAVGIFSLCPDKTYLIPIRLKYSNDPPHSQSIF